MFYKVENGQLVKAPEKSLKVFIANPTDEQYRLFGYTDEIVEDETPVEQEGKIIEEYYEQKDGVVYKHYRVVDVPESSTEQEEIIQNGR